MWLIIVIPVRSRKEIRDHPTIKKLLSLKMPTKDYVVFGGGVMFAHGFYDLPSDVDVLARGKAWKKAKEHHLLHESKLGDVVVKLFDGKVEIFKKMDDYGVDVDKMIAEADVIGGIRFAKLGEVLRIKKQMGREKDKKHMEMIREYMRKRWLERRLGWLGLGG